MRQFGIVLIIMSIISTLFTGCERPEKKAEDRYHNTYKTVKILMISSEHRKTEGWVEVQEKFVERQYGKIDNLYLVFRKDKLVGYVTADNRAFLVDKETLPYELENRTNRYDIDRHIGTYRTLAINVQKILGVPYPVKVE